LCSCFFVVICFDKTFASCSKSLNKNLEEICLVDQAFVKNPDMTITQLLKEKGAKVNCYARFEKGEGLQKREENFAEEVMKQIK